MKALVLVMALLVGGCAGSTAGQVLGGLQAVTSTIGSACDAGIFPPDYCAYARLAWFAEQTLASAWERYVSNPTPETKAAFDTATVAAEKAQKNLLEAKP